LGPCEMVDQMNEFDPLCLTATGLWAGRQLASERRLCDLTIRCGANQNGLILTLAELTLGGYACDEQDQVKTRAETQ
jgi:hypothetical protein